MRKDFAASKFEIVSWGTGRTFDTPYSPEQGIQVPPKTLVNIKIRYTIPEPAAIIGIAADRRAAGRIFKCNSSGERVCRIYVRNDSSSLNISIHPQKGGLLKNIISIPCNIRIRK